VEHEHDHAHDGTDRAHTHGHPEPITAPEPAAPPVRVGHRHRHRHDDIPAPYGAAGAVTVGLIHGIGVETPTQVLALAAGTASFVPFLTGLFLANTVVAVVAVVGLTDRRLRVLNGAVGAFSLYVGVPYLLGASPPLVW
jgi:hypothetical protein